MTSSIEARKFDISHLVATLVSLREPSRAADRVIDAMLAGSSVASSISLIDLRLSRWITNDAIPAYTAGGRAVSVLAHRLGMRLETVHIGNGFEAIASDGGGSKAATGFVPGAAMCAALAALAVSRQGDLKNRPVRL